MQKHRPHYLAHIPFILLPLLLAVFPEFPELPVILFILRAIDRKAERREQEEDAIRWRMAQEGTPGPGEYGYRASGAYGATAPGPGEYGYRAANAGNSAEPAAAAQEAAPTDPVTDAAADHPLDPPTDEQKKARERQETLITLCTIAGGILLLLGTRKMVDAYDTIRWLGLSMGVLLDELLPSMLQMAGGSCVLALSVIFRRTRKLEKQLDVIVGDRDNIPLNELFAAAGIEPAKGRPVLEDAIEHGYFGADAYIDNRTQTLVVRGPAPEPAAPPPPQPAPAPDGETEAQRMLRQLREANDAIRDPLMTAKIGRLEHVSARIFELADADPEKRPRLQKFTEYYLPTSLRLLNTYAQLERQPVEGQNIQEAKRSIENSMDMLVTAFENQLDKLFQSDALDVTADIAALQGMLNMDGLTGASDFGADTTPLA